MSSQADRTACARAQRVQRDLSWNTVIQIARNEDSATLCLLAVAGLLASLYVAILIDIPAAETLLQLPL